MTPDAISDDSGYLRVLSVMTPDLLIVFGVITDVVHSYHSQSPESTLTEPGVITDSIRSPDEAAVHARPPSATVSPAPSSRATDAPIACACVTPCCRAGRPASSTGEAGVHARVAWRRVQQS